MSSEVVSSCCPSIIYMMTGIRYLQLDVLSSEEFIGAEEYMLFAVADGIAEIDIGHGTQGIVKASLAIVEPDQAIHIHTYKNSISFYVITFKAVQIPDLNASEHKHEQQPAMFPYKGIWNHIPFARCIDLLEEIYLHSQDKEEFMRFLNHVRFGEFLGYVLQQNSSMTPVRDLKDAVKSSIDYLSNNYSVQVTVAQLAADVNVFPWQYSQMFKELTGQIPLSFVNKLRIDHAKQLLLKTEDRIHEIAQHVGFNNEFYFNRRFKKLVGVAPGQYRKQQRSTVRVVSLYMEDLLITLGVIPVVQWSHPGWGRQEYLGLKHVPTFNVLQDSYESLSEYEPDIIIARRSDYELRTNQYEQCKQFMYTDMIIHDDMDLYTTLRTLAERLGRVDQAEYAIQQYEDKLSRARKLLFGSMRNQTYAFLRITADYISVDQKYTNPFLWKDLGISPHPMVQALTHEAGRQGVTWEWLNGLDADYIFFAFDKWHEEIAGSERQQIDHPMWQTIPAVRNLRAFEVDFMTWMNRDHLLANSKKIDDVLRMLAQ